MLEEYFLKLMPVFAVLNLNIPSNIALSDSSEQMLFWERFRLAVHVFDFREHGHREHEMGFVGKAWAE